MILIFLEFLYIFKDTIILNKNQINLELTPKALVY